MAIETISAKPAMLAANKLVSPREVPSLLSAGRAKLFRKLEESGALMRIREEVPVGMRRKVLREAFRLHSDSLAPFFHPSVKMIGGVAGERPDEKLLLQLAKLQFHAWGKKDGGLKSVQDYLKMLEAKTGPTPIFVYFRADGNVEGAVFPRQVKTLDVTTWDRVVRKDGLEGDVLVCAMICSYMMLHGAGKALITKGVLPYATVLTYLRYISDLIAYSRPADYGPEKRDVLILEHILNDPNWAKFHYTNDARMLCVVKNGINKLDEKTGRFGFIAGYTKHTRPSGEFLAVLEKIGQTVEQLLRAETIQ
ncbi:MAG: hypothetical protein WC861_05645 [Candidatus Micrarchaeia archaeon]|jgi:hypothetical protein